MDGRRCTGTLWVPMVGVYRVYGRRCTGTLWVPVVGVYRVNGRCTGTLWVPVVGVKKMYLYSLHKNPTEAWLNNRAGQ